MLIASFGLKEGPILAAEINMARAASRPPGSARLRTM
jgi:hypothetical protein